MLVISALCWAIPCQVLQGELSLSVSEPAPHSAHHAPLSAAVDPHAHHAGHAAEPEPSSEWKPACPCGCDQIPSAGTSIGRIGWALVPTTSLPALQGSVERWLAIDDSPQDDDVHSIDHVPIPS